MRKVFIAFLCPLALAATACSTPGAIPMESPAPLNQTQVDDVTLDTAWRSFDLALDAINLMTDEGLIEPGSERAKAIATAIRKVETSLSAAEHFATAGSTNDYLKALSEANAGVSDLRILVKG